MKWPEDFVGKIVVGDCREVLRRMPASSVHCCVTSPPYWGLRDYGGKVQLGLEKTPEEFVEKMVAVFREVRRVLRDDGTLWLNFGDSYAANRGYQVPQKLRGGTAAAEAGAAGGRSSNAGEIGLKPKDLVGIPWRIAFALQADGWYLRSDIIWSKPNPMPESVTDRPTKAHEYIFLMAKSERYFYDAEAIKETVFWPEGPNSSESIKSPYGQGFTRRSGNKERKPATERGCPNEGVAGSIPWEGSNRNKRSVWTVTTLPYAEAHFATFPPKLIEPCILAGTSEKGACSECGSPTERKTKTAVSGDFHECPKDLSGQKARGWKGLDSSRLHNQYFKYDKTTVDWKTGCAHSADRHPCIVLDPFMGAGTVALAAAKHSRRFVGIELNPDYAKMARKRIANEVAQGKLL